jgi:putative SOS response-associated peptidase YedK
MCFYFGIKDPVKKIEKRFNKPLQLPHLFTPTEKHNGFAHPIIPIIANDKPNEITWAKWGLLPTWAKDNNYAKNTLNARIETLETLPSFKNNVDNRCLVIANYFYDWRHEGKNKIPYIIHSQENELFCFAGIYCDWKDNTNSLQRTFTILTTQANTTMQYIHNTKQRMPVILHPQDENNWLQATPIAHFGFPYQVPLLGFTI